MKTVNSNNANTTNNKTIKSKIIFLITTLNIIIMGVFMYYTYNDMKNIIYKPINNHLISVANMANNTLLKEYHNNIEDTTSISDSEYIDMRDNLSKMAEDSNVYYIYSYMMVDVNVSYTSTSATKKNIEDGEWEKYLDNYAKASFKLKNLLKNDSFEPISEDDKEDEDYGLVYTVFVPFKTLDNQKYIIGVDIKIEYINNLLYQMGAKIVFIGIILIIASMLISTFIINIFLQQIPMIKDALIQFFKYLNEETDTVDFIDIKSNDELGQMAKVINDNILKTKDNIVQDDAMINNIKEVSELISYGSFKNRISINANSPLLNESKDVMNEMLTSIQDIIQSVITIIGEYSNYNYEITLDTKKYKEQFLELIDSVNKLGHNISQEKLKSAYDSISIQKSSNYLKEYIEDVDFLLNNISGDITKVFEQLSLSEKSNIRSQNKVSEIISEKQYLKKIIDDFKQNTDKNEFELDKFITDMDYSLHKFEDMLNHITKEITNKYIIQKEIEKPLILLNDNLSKHEEKSKNTLKVANDLSSVSKEIRESISQCKFIGKDNINIVMQYIDR